ncbi:MAG TPA: hypothetical protein VE197_05240 [Mycobacterium sp.]|nr:hypothetical protein [Mycobacterium sp.]
MESRPARRADQHDRTSAKQLAVDALPQPQHPGLPGAQVADARVEKLKIEPVEVRRFLEANREPPGRS